MDARCGLQRIVAVLFGVGALSFPVFADSVYTYRGNFNLQIPAELDTGEGCRVNPVFEIDCHLISICKRNSI